jgi:NitT/TauT family transport system substrate-binding protein
MRIVRTCAVAAALVVCALAGPAPGAAAAAEKASLRLDWSLVGYHLPFYWAQAKGYYAQEGIDLSIGEGTGSGATVQIMSGNKDTFGFADTTVLANGTAKGMPIKAVATPLQIMTFAYVSYEATGIKAPKDLMGRSVAVVAAHETLHQLFLEKHSIPPDKVLRRVATPQTRNVLLAEKKVDAFLSIIIGTPLDFVVKEKQGGEKVSFLRFADWGVHTLGYSIVAHNQTIAERPAVVRGFLRATRKAWLEVPANLEEALRIAVKQSPRGPGNEDSIRLGFQESTKMLHSRNTQGRPWGWMAQADWEETQNVLLATKSIEKAIPLDQYYSNAFLPE